MDCSLPGFSVRGDSPGKNTGVGGHALLLLLSLDLSNPGIEPRSPTVQADSLSSEPSGKPKNTEVGSLYLLQGIFLTQQLNQCLLHCRQILYQLSYQGSSWFVIYGLYYVGMCCLITYWEIFIMLDVEFCQNFCLFRGIHMIFILQFLNVVCYSNL